MLMMQGNNNKALLVWSSEEPQLTVYACSVEGRRSRVRPRASAWAGGSARPPSGLSSAALAIPSEVLVASFVDDGPTDKLNPQYKYNPKRIPYSVPRQHAPVRRASGRHVQQKSCRPPSHVRQENPDGPTSEPRGRWVWPNPLQVPRDGDPRPTFSHPSKQGEGRDPPPKVGRHGGSAVVWELRVVVPPPHSRRRRLVSDATQKRVVVVTV